jgi:hypothetical protein
MKGKQGKKPDKKTASAKKKTRDAHEFETMSQIENRYGKGRQQNGSDGENQIRGSNH